MVRNDLSGHLLVIRAEIDTALVRAGIAATVFAP